MTNQIANTILAQLGGHRFIAMTGSHSFIADNSALIFTTRKNEAQVKLVKISLTSDDTYDMTFWKQAGATQGFKVEVVKEFQGVYADMLQELFKDVTGFDTHL